MCIRDRRHTRSYGRRAKAAALLHVGHMNGFQAVYDRWYYFEWISPKSSDVPCIKVQPDICILYLPANIKENRRIICKVHTRPCARLAMEMCIRDSLYSGIDTDFLS